VDDGNPISVCSQEEANFSEAGPRGNENFSSYLFSRKVPR
jgi:hypothetical protein